MQSENGICAYHNLYDVILIAIMAEHSDVVMKTKL